MSSLVTESSINTSNNNTNIFNVKYEHLIAGLSGGVISTLILHPLDVIKLRFAVNDGRIQRTPKYSGIADAFVTIYREEGVRGLYRGVTPNVIGAGSSWGIYFFFYNSLKHRVRNENVNAPLGPLQHLLAASQAGVITLFLTNPLWVIKTRLCLQYGCNKTGVVEYKGMLDAFVKIYRLDGIKGYYKGFIPGIFGVSHGAVQFMVYEELKKYYNSYYNLPISFKLGTLEYLIFAAVSKFVAVATTYPYQVLRARLQNQHYVYNGVWQCINETWIYEGWKGFYKGLGTNLLRVTPATMITFLTYENVSYFLLERESSDTLPN